MGVAEILDQVPETVQLGDADSTSVAIEAWRQASFVDVCHVVTDYYMRRGVQVFAYPESSGGSVRVPLYVRQEWRGLDLPGLEMAYVRRRRSYEPSEAQRRFLALYQKVRREVALSPIYDGDIFRLVELRNSDGGLVLTFEDGSFYASVMCQYLLEHEAVMALKRGSDETRGCLPLRDQVACDGEMIEGFCRGNVARIGVSNLVLLRSGRDSYWPLVQQRGPASLSQGLDALSSGVFGPGGRPEMDFDLQRRVLTELAEEAFGMPEAGVAGGDGGSRSSSMEDGVGELLSLLRGGGASFEVTGFCIDLVRVVPELTTVLIVRDGSYYRRYHSMIALNREYRPTSEFQVPRDMGNVDQYLAEKVVSDPGSHPPSYGFDPFRWTLNGAFCFYQGLVKATADGLL